MNANVREYALVKGKIVEWSDFVRENPWATVKTNPFSAVPVASNCISVYYVVDLEKMNFMDRLCMVTWDLKYKSEFKELSLMWVKQYFEVEESDLKQLETPEEAIIQPGGEIFFLLESSGRVAGVVATVIHQGNCELAKMTVRKECNGKGYAHILMRESINWAQDNKYPFIELLSSIQLENAIILYKKYGFETTHLGSHPDYKRCNIIMRLTF
ncbi:GNAT family acetyltransferase [Mucor ambiguus]|uniref:GNAT family acetyltransferase n=1 Tax=Mucor ambiguus TaxID=91626 RepID=A0A0C9M3F0_9FUNG|nr:GNAT family acetyltransferase [Mucor ambiguus]